MATKKQPSVFEKYAHEYDLITNAAQRESYHRKEIDALIAHFNPSSVLDAGCASGLTAMLFARRGVEAVGLDCSRRMIEVAREKYDSAKLPLSFRVGNFERLPRNMHSKFDLVVCLANSISGVSSVAGVRQTLKNFHAVIKPGGWLVLQMLNYSSMKEGTLFPIRATANHGIIYERFSERRGKRLSVYVSRLDLKKSPQQFEVFRHDFDNYDLTLVRQLVAQAGFDRVSKFSDLYLKKQFTRSSRDLVLIGQRSGR